MRLVVLKDKKITEKEFNTLIEGFKELYRTNAGIEPVFYVHEKDFTTYPSYTAADGYGRITDEYMTNEVNTIYKAYGDHGTDHIIFLIHRDNWKLTGLWGENFSNKFRTYHVEVCRFDNKNAANSLGTLYHEVMHSHDALVYALLGINIESFAKVQDWDNACVHGKETPWKYIRWKENQDALKAIATPLKLAYTKRKELYATNVSLMKKVINLAQQVLVLQRAVINKKTNSCS